MSTLRYLSCSLLALAGICYADPSTNLVTNGGFETGSFSGWSLSGNVTPCLFVGTSSDARCIPTTGLGGHSGAYAAELGNSGGDAILSQSINTSAGGTYELTFWLASQAYSTPSNDFSVSWGGTTLMSGVNLPAFGYTLYDFTGLTATGASTILSFRFQNNPSYFALDDISVADPRGVPESHSAVVLSVLLCGLLFHALRRRGGLAHEFARN